MNLISDRTGLILHNLNLIFRQPLCQARRGLRFHNISDFPQSLSTLCHPHSVNGFRRRSPLPTTPRVYDTSRILLLLTQMTIQIFFLTFPSLRIAFATRPRRISLKRAPAPLPSWWIFHPTPHGPRPFQMLSGAAPFPSLRTWPDHHVTWPRHSDTKGPVRLCASRPPSRRSFVHLVSVTEITGFRKFSHRAFWLIAFVEHTFPVCRSHRVSFGLFVSPSHDFFSVFLLFFFLSFFFRLHSPSWIQGGP